MDDETAAKIRGLSRRVNLKNFKDDGETQTASVEVAEGIWRDDVEIAQTAGVVGMPNEDGAVGILQSIGGDEGDMVITNVTNPSTRMGKMPAGSVGHHTPQGDKSILTPDGQYNVETGAKANIKTPETNVKSDVVNLGNGGQTKAAGINHLVHVTFGSSAGMHPIATGSPIVNLTE